MPDYASSRSTVQIHRVELKIIDSGACTTFAVLQRVHIRVVADFEVATWKEIGGVLVDAVHVSIFDVFEASGFSNSIQVV